MNMCMTSYRHCFLLPEEGFKLDVKDADNLFFFHSYSSLFREKQFRRMLSEADVIVVSGVFMNIWFFLYLALSPALLRKTVFHFWGGDFYWYREDTTTKYSIIPRVKKGIKQHLASYCFKNCCDLAFLIPGEYAAFQKIFKIHRSHSVVKMPASPNRKKSSEFRNHRTHSGTRIVLGNSATETNCHSEILRLLHDQYGGEAIEVYSPLSYGSSIRYKDSVIALGDELLGEKFIPITQYMDIDAYYDFLSDCDIGIFNNNRQQGMGNIRALLALGKKVYIRSDTAMWDYFREGGYILFPVEEIQNQTFDDFISLPAQIRDSNMRNFDGNNSTVNSLNAWTPFLQKAISKNKTPGGKS